MIIYSFIYYLIFSERNAFNKLYINRGSCTLEFLIIKFWKQLHFKIRIGYWNYSKFLHGKISFNL